MFDLDNWREIYSTLSQNKLRTGLTAFGVGWGLLMLIIMLGAGNGLQNGVNQEFQGMAVNSVSMWSRSTSKAYQGYNKGRYIRLTNEDTRALMEQSEYLEHLSPGLSLGGWRGANNIRYNGRIGAFEINGFYPVIAELRSLKVIQGRFMNDRDIAEERKICILGRIAYESLYDAGENPIGTYVQIQGVFFKVVGVYQSLQSGNNAEEAERSAYIPFSTFQRAFNQGNQVHWYSMTSKPGIKASKLEDEAVSILKKRHHVHPDDYRAIGSWNMQDEYQKFQNIFTGINALSWFVGVLTLLAGIIGISNIMLVIIKERTKEIGIRRAIGAEPNHLIRQIMLEGLVLTLMAGFAGFVCGFWLIETLSGFISHDFFKNPEINLQTAILALVILAVSGTFAGILPSIRAVRIKPIEALRTE